MKRTAIVVTMTSLAIVGVLFAGQPISEQSDGMQKCRMNKTHCKKMDEKRKHCHKMDRKKHHFFKMIQNELTLNSTQEKALDTIIEESMIERKVASMKDHFKEMKQDRKDRKDRKAKKGTRDMSKFMSADKFDKEAFKKVMQAKDQKRNEMMQKRDTQRIDHRADTMEKIFAILTPEQRTKLIELSQKK